MSAAGATEQNREFYDAFWGNCPDFIRYNPGARHRRRIVGELLRGVPGRTLLDVGCGAGEMMRWLRAEFNDRWQMTGADVSPESVRRNQTEWPSMHFAMLDVQRAHLPTSYDVVLCSEVVEHLDDRESAFANLSAMTAQGGYLLVTCPTGRVFETERHFGHTTHPEMNELRAHADRNGLRIERAMNWGWPLYRSLKWATNVNADWALRNFTEGKYSASAKALSKMLYWANYLNLANSTAGCQLFALMRKSA